MKKCFRNLIALITIYIFLLPQAAAAATPPVIEAKAAILLEASTGAVLFAQAPHQRMYPASTTKILTALLATETGDLDEIVTVGPELYLVAPNSSLAYLEVGDTLTLRDLVYGLMLPSGNDAAYVIAVHLARRQEGQNLPVLQAIQVFSRMMNQRAQALGATESNFTCPDGFHADDHYTTAYDLALIAQAAMKLPFLREVVATPEYTAASWQGGKPRRWENNNLLIDADSEAFYPAATGLKTGYTGPAGFCLVSAASDKDLSLIAVNLKTSLLGRWSDSRALLDYGFANFSWRQLVQASQDTESFFVSNGDWEQPNSVTLAAREGFTGLFSQAEAERIKREIILDPTLLDSETAAGATGFTLRAPLCMGQVAGQVKFTLEGKELFTTDLIITADVASLPWWRTEAGMATMGIGLLLLLFLLLLLERRRSSSLPPFRR